jgi:hypothetical protein
MFGLFDWFKIGVGAVAGAVLAGTVMYWVGIGAGKREAEVNTLRASVQAEVKRKGIENAVTALDRYAICIDLGGLPDECEQLRRMAETAQGEQSGKAGAK